MEKCTFVLTMQYENCMTCTLFFHKLVETDSLLVE